MGESTWYYGYAGGVAPSAKNTGGVHDLGDGIYLTRDLDTARAYSKLRLDRPGATGDSYVFQVKIDLGKFRVLNLAEDEELSKSWRAYLNSEPGLPGAGRTPQPKAPTGRPAITVEFLMRRSSEQYFRFFQAFLDQEKLSLNNYDFVIGQDFHSGATGRVTEQLVVLYKNAGGRGARQVTTVHAQILEAMQPVEKNGMPLRVVNQPTLVVGGPNVTPGAALRTRIAPRVDGASPDASRIPVVRMTRETPSPAARMATVVNQQNQAAEAATLRWSGYAAVTSAFFAFLNNASVQKSIEDELKKRQNELDAAFNRNLGVLVVLHLAQERHSESGFKARSFQSLSLVPGTTADAALTTWRSQDRWEAALPRNAPYVDVEDYVWLMPQR